MMNKFYILALTAIFALSASKVSAQKFAVKTNLLYGATKTPNLGVEFGLGERSTLEISGGYNPWNLDGERNNNKKLVHALGYVEYRKWTCSRFNGHFFGAHALGSMYNIGQYGMDFIFGKNSNQFRHEGYAVGAGLSYGYHWILSNRLSLEANVGAGVVYFGFDRYNCPRCGDKIGSDTKLYIGPTRAGIKLLYIIK